jgi:hypothetical protein
MGQLSGKTGALLHHFSFLDAGGGGFVFDKLDKTSSENKISDISDQI